MLHNDKCMFALLLLRIYLTCFRSDTLYEPYFDHLLLKSELFVADASKSILDQAAATHILPLSERQKLPLFALALQKGMKNVVQNCANCEDLEKFMHADKPELAVPQLWDCEEEIGKCSWLQANRKHYIAYLWICVPSFFQTIFPLLSSS